MGIMKVSEFQADLVDALGRTPDPARMLRWINNATLQYAYAFKFPELQKVGSIALVQGQYPYALPGDFRAFSDVGIRIATPQTRFGGILTSEDRSSFLISDRFPSTSNYGTPRYYHKYANQLYVRPAPDATVSTLEFDYWARMTPLAAPTDTIPFPDDWDYVTFTGALAMGHLAYGEHDRLINVFNLYIGSIRSRTMAEDLEEFPEGGISYIESQWANNFR